MIAIANGLIQANGRTLLREYGRTIELWDTLKPILAPGPKQNLDLHFIIVLM